MDVIFHMNEHETGHTPPVLDTLIQNRPIQMLKAIVPYLYGPQQRMISMMVRMIELQRTMQPRKCRHKNCESVPMNLPQSVPIRF